MSIQEKALHVKVRDEFGSASARRYRRNGQIPSVVYGGDKNHHVLVDAHEFHHEFRHHISENTIIQLHIDGKKSNVLVKDFQSDILTSEVFHIDFLEVVAGHMLKTHIPVVWEGTPKGVKEGGLLEHLTETIEVECLPEDMPESFVVDVSGLGLNDSLPVSSIAANPKVKILNPPQQILAHISVPRGVASASASESAETPAE